MVKKNAVLVLANNMKFFKLMVDNLPDSINECTLIVINEQRIGDKTGEIQKILENSKVENYKIFGSDLINRKFKELVHDNEFVEDYKMSMNILGSWFVFKFNKNIDKILLLDDDVILREGFERVFNSNHCMFKYNRLSAGMADFHRQSDNAISIFDEWFRIFDIKFTDKWWSEKYLKRYANSGQRLFVRNQFDIKQYEQKLTEFFESEIFFDAWRGRRSHVSWYFDERFETFYFFDILNDEMKDYAYLVLTSPEKMDRKAFISKVKRSSIIHNATNSHKDKIYNILIEEGCLVGDKL